MFTLLNSRYRVCNEHDGPKNCAKPPVSVHFNDFTTDINQVNQVSINSFFFLMMHLQSPQYGRFTTWRFLVSNQFIASEWKRREQKWMKGHEKSLPTTSCSTKHVVLSWCTNHALLGFLYQMGYIHAYRNDTEMKQRW